MPAPPSPLHSQSLRSSLSSAEFPVGATTRERVRDLGMLEAVGLTPRQVSASLVSEQVVIAVAAPLARRAASLPVSDALRFE